MTYLYVIFAEQLKYMSRWFFSLSDDHSCMGCDEIYSQRPIKTFISIILTVLLVEHTLSTQTRVTLL